MDPQQIERLIQIQEEQDGRLAIAEKGLRRVRTYLVCLVCWFVFLPILAWLLWVVFPARSREAGKEPTPVSTPSASLSLDDKVAEAKSDESTLAAELEAFHLDCDRYPTTKEGLQALVIPPPDLAIKWKGPYGNLSTATDPWGNAYVYKRPGIKGGTYSITSYGSDGRPGGVFFGQDIVKIVQ